MRFLLTSVLLLLLAQTVDAETPSITWQIAREAGGPVDGTQRWMRFMERATPRAVTFRRARLGEKPSVTQTGNSNRYTVTAVLTKRNRLQLPGREIALGDLAGLMAWTEQLSDSSERTKGASDSVAFGMSARELARVREQLAAAVVVSTRDQPRADVFEALRRQVRLVVTVDARARERIAGSSDVVADEIRGLSLGTALAAVLRPLGLVLVPQVRSGRAPMLRIREASRTRDSWPVGWQPERADRLVLPKLMEKLPVEIVDMPIGRVLDALQPRLDCPILIDHGQLAAANVDLSKTAITFKSQRAFYKRILEQVLFQARLQLDVRVDDAGNGFLWVEQLRLSP